jgi:3-oxoacyl-[acyl-carrier-protein] synthase II
MDSLPPEPGVYVTGVGSISAIGWDPQSVADGYRSPGTRIRPREHAGRLTAVGALSDPAERSLGVFLAARPRYAELDRTVHLATYAARQAAASAGWHMTADACVMVGSSRGATGLLERYHTEFLAGGEGKTGPLTSPTTTLGNISNWVAQELHTEGAACEMSSTCSTSAYALGTGLAWLQAGMGKRALVGGAEAPLTDFTIAQMRALRIYASDAECELPCRPCADESPRRNTMVLGEGAALLALERLDPDELARWEERMRQERGEVPSGSVLARVLGAGFSVEAIETNTSVSEEGNALRRSMRQALARAGRDAVDVVVTHTPGTALGDRAELNAIRRVFGNRLPVLTSNKWLLGHTLGASGALGIEYALLILRTQRWVDYPYPVPFQNAPCQVRTVMVNSVGFGGNAASILLSR